MIDIPMSAEGMIDIAGAAERLGVSHRFIRRLVSERRIPYYKIGHYIRFDRDELNDWLCTQRRPVATSRAA
jgi:excisionase family DNA binding protein